MIELLDNPNIVAQKRKSPVFEHEIIKYLSQFARLSEAEAVAIVESVTVQAFKKGDFLLKEGQITDLCCFVIKGCVRQYYLIDGEEKTTNFYTEGQPVPPHEGSVNQMPAKFYLSCVEDSVVTTGSKVSEEAFFENFPKLFATSNTALEAQWVKQQEQLSNFIIHSPEERYLHLLETRPDLLDRVPHYQIASYLGIKPESLSRIRKRIMLK